MLTGSHWFQRRVLHGGDRELNSEEMNHPSKIYKGLLRPSPAFSAGRAAGALPEAADGLCAPSRFTRPWFLSVSHSGHLQPIKSRSPFTWTDWVLSQTDRDVFEVWLSTETLLGDKRAYFVNEQTNKSHRAETGLYSLQETKAHLELTALNYIKNHSENAVLLQKLVRDADCVFSALCDTSVRGQLTSVSSTPSFSSASWNCSFGSRPPPLHVLARLAKFWGSPRLTLPFKASTKYSSTEILSKLFFMDWLTHLGKLYSEFRPDKRCSLSW